MEVDKRERNHRHCYVAPEADPWYGQASCISGGYLMKHVFTSFVFLLAFVATFVVVSILTVPFMSDDIWHLRVALELLVAAVVAFFCARSIFRSYDGAAERNAKAAQEYNAKLELQAAAKAAAKADPMRTPWLR